MVEPQTIGPRDERAPAGSWASSEAVRRTMRGNRSRDTAPELAVRRLLHARGLRYRVGCRPEEDLNRRADIVFRRSGVAVFIDGCYWHGCPEHYSQPRANAEYWSAKIGRNVARDRETTTALTNVGWLVLRYWEHEAPETVAQSITDAVRARGTDSRSRVAGTTVR